MEFVVRGVGLIERAEDLGKIVPMKKDGAAICLKDVARIELGGDFRRGSSNVDGHEVVVGTVVMRNGENARDVIAGVKAKIAQLSPSLPPGVTIKPFYDRSALIERTIGMLSSLLHILLVTPVIFLWLGTRDLAKATPSWRTRSRGRFFDMKNAPFEEIPVAGHPEKEGTATARKRLSTVLAGLDPGPVLKASAANAETRSRMRTRRPKVLRKSPNPRPQGSLRRHRSQPSQRHSRRIEIDYARHGCVVDHR